MRLLHLHLLLLRVLLLFLPAAVGVTGRRAVLQKTSNCLVHVSKHYTLTQYCFLLTQRLRRWPNKKQYCVSVSCLVYTYLFSEDYNRVLH